MERVELTSLAFGGSAVGRRSDGKVLFVPYGAPGDIAEVAVTRERRSHAEAELTALVQPSPQRREPVCEHFERCGGCQWLHLRYAAQLKAKEQIVRSALRDYSVEPEVFAAPEELGYRWRTRLQLRPTAKGSLLGFLMRKSREVVEVERCPLLVPPLQEALKRCRDALADLSLGAGELVLQAGTGGDVQLSLRARRASQQQLARLMARLKGFGGVLVGAGAPLAFGAQSISGAEDPQPLQISAKCVMQANEVQNRRLCESVAQLASGERVLEFYAGAGNLTRCLSPKSSVIAVEQWPEAAALLRKNSRGWLQQVEVQQRAAAPTDLPWIPQTILMDPPREGCHPELLRYLQEIAAPQLVYVSCDPMTLARDLKRLGPGYSLRRLVAIDMMPQTYHIELVVQLCRC